MIFKKKSILFFLLVIFLFPSNLSNSKALAEQNEFRLEPSGAFKLYRGAGGGGATNFIKSTFGSISVEAANAFIAKVNNNKDAIAAYANDRVDLYHNDQIKLTTTEKGIKVGTGVTIETNGQATFSGITTFAGNINLIGELNTDTARIRLPDGMNGGPFTGNLEFGNNRDFVMLHDGHHNYVRANNGNIYITFGSNVLTTLQTNGTVL